MDENYASIESLFYTTSVFKNLHIFHMALSGKRCYIYVRIIKINWYLLERVMFIHQMDLSGRICHIYVSIIKMNWLLLKMIIFEMIQL